MFVQFAPQLKCTEHGLLDAQPVAGPTAGHAPSVTYRRRVLAGIAHLNDVHGKHIDPNTMPVLGNVNAGLED